MSDAPAPAPTSYPAISRHDRLLNLSPWLVGAEIDFLLQGVLWVMTANYFRHYKKDNKIYRGFVIIINILCFGKTVQSFLIAWDRFVTKFGNFMTLVQDNPPWQGSEPLTTSIVGAIAQSFFMYRLYKLLGPKAWPLYFLILGCSIMGLSGAIWLTALIFNPPALTSSPETFARYGDLANQAVTLMLAGVFVADFLISGSMIFHLLRSRNGFKSTNDLIDRVVQITWTSALPPTACAIFNLGFYVGQANSSIVHLAWNMALSKLYAISAVYMLNARDDLRSWYGTAQVTNPSTGSSGRTARTKEGLSISSKIRPQYSSQQPGTRIEIQRETRVDGVPAMYMDIMPSAKTTGTAFNDSESDTEPRKTESQRHHHHMV